MRKPIFSFTHKLTSKAVYDKFPKKEQEQIDKFKDYLLITAGSKRVEGGIAEIIRFKEMIGKEFSDIDLEDLRYFLKELKQCDFADYTKNRIKSFVQRFLRWGYKDWSERFDEFKDIINNNDAQRKNPIETKDMLSEEQIMKLLEAEPTLYWKTFLMVSAQGGLRTGEARMLLWDSVIFEDDGFTVLNIPSKKNKNGTIKIKPVVIKSAGKFLKKLQEQQTKYEIKSKYVFPSPNDPNKPISKTVNIWFSNLCKKVLGHTSNNYILRHSKGTELQKKVREGTLSKDNAVEFMRHSEKMFDKVYSHMDKTQIKQLMKKQIYNTKELTEKDKNDYEKRIQFLETSYRKQKALTEKVLTMAEKTTSTLEVLEKKYPKINLT